MAGGGGHLGEDGAHNAVEARQQQQASRLGRQAHGKMQYSCKMQIPPHFLFVWKRDAWYVTYPSDYG